MSTWLKLLRGEATDLRAGREVGVGLKSTSLFPDRSCLVCVSDVGCVCVCVCVCEEVSREINAEVWGREFLFIKHLLCAGFFLFLSHHLQ